MELADLVLFQEVVRHGSISQAARLLHLTQPTASRHLQRLEAEVGAALLDRQGVAVRPTRAGLTILRFAAVVLPQAERLQEELRSATALAGDLDIAASTMPGESFVPGLVAAFAERHQGLQATLHVMDSQAVERCVVDGTCQVGFVGQPPRPGLLAFHPVGEDELLLAVPRGHPYFDLGEVPPETLSQQAFVERAPGSGTRRTAEELLREAGIPYEARRIVLVANSAQAVLAAVRSGVGVGFVSRTFLDGPPSGAVRGLRVAGMRLQRRIYLLHLPDPGPAAGAFISFAVTMRRESSRE